jgi:hypothetical protein
MLKIADYWKSRVIVLQNNLMGFKTSSVPSEPYAIFLSLLNYISTICTIDFVS